MDNVQRRECPTVYVFTYVCMYVCLHVCMYVSCRLFTEEGVSRHMSVFEGMYVCIFVYICTYTCMSHTHDMLTLLLLV